MNAFEKAIDALLGEEDEFGLENENAIEFLRNAKTATVSFTQGRYVRKIRKLAEKYPDLVKIIYDSGRVVTAYVPVSAVRISIVPPREMTEEQKAEARERLARYRRQKQAENDRAGADEQTQEDVEEEILEEYLESKETEEEKQ